MATSQEMQIVLALVDRYRAGEESNSKFTKHKVEELPVWSRMLPLHIVRTDDQEQKHPSFDGFAVPFKVLVTYMKDGHQGLALQDSAYLFQQVRKAEILLDSTAFELENIVTPQQYKQPQVRRKIHNYGFYRFSQPLFSSDNSSAYIQVDEAGCRKSYRLLKKQGKWTIIHQLLFWVV